MWKVLGAGLLLLAGQAFGSEAVGCQARLQTVNNQLVSAKAHHNAGQEQAAHNIKANKQSKLEQVQTDLLAA
ncbi:hypothetical protein [Aeromonas fluvialis]|uniref:hypothetical protein n=1 Tax=Aeromonas fluvialis TaxID=591962 RepID=UPI0005AB8F13|nr:hypothetical protein [Aeromonas fluvialis]